MNRSRAIAIPLVVIAAVLTVSAAAQPMHFGEPFALTNTRYPSLPGWPYLLRSDGRDAYLFWSSAYAGSRVTRMIDGMKRGGLPTVSSQSFDVVWVGTHFVMATIDGQGALSTHLLNVRGESLTAPYTITHVAADPKLAFNGRTLLLLYTEGTNSAASRSVRAIALTPNGRPVDGVSEHVSSDSSSPAAVASTGTGFAALTSVRGTTVKELRLTTFDSSGRIKATRSLMSGYASGGAIASNGRESLAVWTSYDTGVEAAIVRSDGTTKPVPVHQWPFGADLDRPSVAWNGTHWIVAYTHRNEEYGVRKFRLYVTTLDFEGQVTSREETTGTGNVSLVATPTGVQLAWHQPVDYSPVSVSHLPLAEHEPATVTYAAPGQSVIGSATSDDATLVVWEEVGDGKRSIFAGIRNLSGEWIERRLADNVYALHVASNGSAFAIVFRNPNFNVHTVIALDTQLSTLWTTTIDQRLAGSIASNGKDYALAGITSDGVVAALLSASGKLGPAVVIAPRSEEQDPVTPRIASNGDGFLVIWETPACWTFTCTKPLSVEGARLHATLQRRDASDILLTPVGSLSRDRVTLAWDGNRYLAAWSESNALSIVGLSSSGPAQPSPANFTNVVGPGAMEPRLTQLRGGAALSWTEAAEVRMAFLSGASVVRVATLGPSSAGTPLITQTPDGRAMLLSSRMQSGAPHHSTRRLITTIENPIPADRPDAPAITARAEGRGIVLHWSPPPQPVSGYRIEYRIGDGSWNELTESFHAGQLSFWFRMSSDVSHAFRMRAWNDAGMSLYSQPAYIGVHKRRAARP